MGGKCERRDLELLRHPETNAFMLMLDHQLLQQLHGLGPGLGADMHATMRHSVCLI